MYVSQSDKGGLVYGGNLDYYNSYAQRGNLPIVHEVASELLAVFPNVGKVRLLQELGRPRRHVDGRQPDHHDRPAPGHVPELRLVLRRLQGDARLGLVLRHTIANDEPHPLNAAFTLERFHEGRPIDERGAGPTPRLH